MPQLMLINPRKRRAHRKARRNPSARKSSVRRSTAPALATNPRRRRRVHHRVAARHRRALRRNPIGASRLGVMGMVTDAGIGAVGAYGVDMIYGMVSGMLPASMSTGIMAAATKGALAVGLGMVGRKAMGRTAEKAAIGSLTVTLYKELYSLTGGSMPLNGMGYVAPAMQVAPVRALGQYVNPDPTAGIYSTQQMGEYIGF